MEPIRLANKFIAEAISQRPQFQFVDVTAVMLTPDGKPDKSLYEPDGLHLNSTGYERWHHQLKGKLA